MIALIAQTTPRGDRRARSDAVARSPRGESRAWQIGPRIRVGGTLGKVGQNVKIAAGKALSNPIVDGALTFVPGVGPGLAAAAGAAGRALDTSGGGLHGLSGLGSLAAGAAEGYGAGKLGVAAKSGLSALMSGSGAAAAKSVFGGGSAGGGGPSADPSEADANDPNNYDANNNYVGPDGSSSGAGASGGGSGGGSDLMSKIKGILGAGASALGGSGGGGLLDSLLLGGSVASQAADKTRVTNLQNSAVDAANSAYNEKAPLRARALAQLSTDQAAPDLSSIFTDAGNVYSRQRAGLPPMTTAPSAASQNTAGNALSGALAARVPANAPA